jgi:nitrate/nitrite transport system ATP-binding protein
LGFPDNEGDRNAFALFDGKVFNPDDPISYLNSSDIHRDIRIEEVSLDPVVTQTSIAA